MSDNWHYFKSQDRDEEGVVDSKGLMDTEMGSGREGVDTGRGWRT